MFLHLSVYSVHRQHVWRRGCAWRREGHVWHVYGKGCVHGKKGSGHV